jgi:hypothetical protein
MTKKRRTIEEIEAPLREAGTIGCRCLCSILHPSVLDVCTGAAQRNVSLLKTQSIRVDVSMCEPCAAILKAKERVSNDDS